MMDWEERRSYKRYIPEANGGTIRRAVDWAIGENLMRVRKLDFPLLLHFREKLTSNASELCVLHMNEEKG